MNPGGTRAFHSVFRLEQPYVPDEDPDIHNSGETALISGIYKATHRAINGAHTGEVVVVKGSQFPSCSCCGESLRFCLLQSANHISEDEDFGIDYC